MTRTQDLMGFVMPSVGKSVRKIKAAAKGDAARGSALVSIDDIQTELGCGRNAAYSVARRIGRRLTGRRRGRLIVSRHALEAWLHGEVAR